MSGSAHRGSYRSPSAAGLLSKGEKLNQWSYSVFGKVFSVFGMVYLVWWWYRMIQPFPLSSSSPDLIWLSYRDLRTFSFEELANWLPSCTHHCCTLHTAHHCTPHTAHWNYTVNCKYIAHCNYTVSCKYTANCKYTALANLHNLHLLLCILAVPFVNRLCWSSLYLTLFTKTSEIIPFGKLTN